MAAPPQDAGLRFAVFGAGGVGGYFGARLAAAGHPVGFIARGAHLAALQQDGLALSSPRGDLTLQPVLASDDPAAVGPVDVVLCCVKLYDIETAAEAMAPLLGPETAVVSLQNGIDAEARLAGRIGRDHVVGGTAQISASIERPGVIRHAGERAELWFAELDGRRTARVEALLAACRVARIDARIVEDLEQALWTKFLFLAPFSAVTCITRKAVGGVLADPDDRAFFADAVREVAAVAAARGVPLPEDAPERVLQVAETLDPGMKSSMLLDLERGRRLEVEHLSGAVVRLGEAAGVPTPRHRAAWEALKPLAAGAG